MMKKAIAFLLLCACFFSLSACSAAVIYEEEKQIKDYVNSMTEGYTQLSESPALKQYTLYDKEKELVVKLKQGVNSQPSLSIVKGKNKKTTTENAILTVTATLDGKTISYGSGNARSEYFDPYRNKYVPNMRVYKKSDTEYRVLFFVIHGQFDFAPLYLGMSGDFYKKVLEGVEKYAEFDSQIFRSSEEETIDYITEFKSMYLPFSLYRSEFLELYGDKFSNMPDQNAYLLTAPSANYQKFLDTVFPQYCGLDMQAARKEYEKLGYTGYLPDLVIVSADITIIDGTSVDVTMSDNIYYSNKAKQTAYEFKFNFCPTLKSAAD